MASTYAVLAGLRTQVADLIDDYSTPSDANPEQRGSLAVAALAEVVTLIDRAIARIDWGLEQGDHS
jgi:hypothetical protein